MYVQYFYKTQELKAYYRVYLNIRKIKIDTSNIYSVGRCSENLKKKMNFQEILILYIEFIIQAILSFFNN